MPYTQGRLLRMLADVISSHFPVTDVELLLQAGVDPNGSVAHGLRPLHYAAFAGDHGVGYIEVLVENGATVNCADDVGYGPLHVAAKAGHVATLKALIQHGADVNGRLDKEVKSRLEKEDRSGSSQAKTVLQNESEEAIGAIRESSGNTESPVDDSQNLQEIQLDNATNVRSRSLESSTRRVSIRNAIRESEDGIENWQPLLQASTNATVPVRNTSRDRQDLYGNREPLNSRHSDSTVPLEHSSISERGGAENSESSIPVRNASRVRVEENENIRSLPQESFNTELRFRYASSGRPRLEATGNRQSIAVASLETVAPVVQASIGAASNVGPSSLTDNVGESRLENIRRSSSITRSGDENRSDNATRSNDVTRSTGENGSDRETQSNSNRLGSQPALENQDVSESQGVESAPAVTENQEDTKEEGTSISMASLADSPLCLAIEHDQMECAEMLLNNGADPNIKSFLGHLINTVPLDSHRCLRLLLKHGADPDALSRGGMTALMRACKQKQIEAVKILLEYGADVNIQCPPRFDRRRAIHFATMVGSLEIVQLLLEAGAYTWKPPGYSCAPLECAVVHDRVDICQLLLDHGADPNELNDDDNTPLQVACSAAGLRQQRQIIEALLRAGARPNLHSHHFSYTGPSLCPLIEYLTYTEELDYPIVKSFLQYGATINFTVPTRLLRIQDACGALGQLRKLRPHDDILALIIDAAGKFDRDAIGRDTSLANGQRTHLLTAATTPRSLAQTCRMIIIRCVTETIVERMVVARVAKKASGLVVNMAETYSSLPIPSYLQRYLLYDV